MSSASEVVIDNQIFQLRLQRLLNTWNSEAATAGSPWHSLTALVFLSGRQNEACLTPKSDQTHLWLFGYVFPETLFVITRDGSLYFLTGPKKLGALKQIATEKTHFLERSSVESQNEASVKRVVDGITATAEQFRQVKADDTSTSSKILVGYPKKKSEIPEGPFAEQIQKFLTQHCPTDKFQEVAVDNTIALVLSVLDERSIASATKAAILAVRLATDVLLRRVEEVLDNEEEESHAEIANRAGQALDDPAYLKKWKNSDDLDSSCLDIVYVNVQSGKSCDLRPSAPATKVPLHTGSGTILLAVGSKYHDYTANITRTILFNVGNDERNAYQAAVESLDFAIRQFLPGKSFAEVHEAVQQFVSQKYASLMPFLIRTWAHTIGIEYREASLTLNGKLPASSAEESGPHGWPSVKIEENMVFNVSIGFQGVVLTEGREPFSIWLADTILVTAAGQQPKNLTAKFDRRFRAVNYQLCSGGENESVAPTPTPKVPAGVKSARPTNRTSVTPDTAAPSGKTATTGAAIATSVKKEPPDRSLSTAGSGARLGSLQSAPGNSDDRKLGTSPRQGMPTSGVTTGGTLKKTGNLAATTIPTAQGAAAARLPSTRPRTTATDGTGTSGKGVGEPTGQSQGVVLRDRLRSRTKTVNFEEAEKLIERQKVLRNAKYEEIKERFKDGNYASFSTRKRSVRKMASILAYRDTSEYPKDARPNKLHLDLIRETVLIPLPGFGLTPFHVMMLRNVICQSEDKRFSTLRIQFQVPGTTGFGYKAEHNPFPEVVGPSGMFIKELIFRSSNPQLPQLCKSIKELQKRVRQREETGDTSQDLAVQQPLELNRKGAKRVLLKNVLAKTGSNTKRVGGSLEAHQTGLRFTCSRSDPVDINYSNIKHAFFQPCEKELLVLVHFNLKNSILANKRKTADIQFYTEVGTQADDLDQRRGRSTYDPDEIAEEQRERELRRRLNLEFKRFVEGVEEMALSCGEPIEFELPYRELGFTGVAKNSSQLILPTAKCLVQLTEWPVFILPLDEIEFVCFERVYHGLRQFDMVIVFKDYSRPVRQIATIPIESLDVIKRWLCEINVVWYESKRNLVWSEVLKTIREDIVGFIEDGGFDIFLGDEAAKDSEASDSDDDGAATESSSECSIDDRSEADDDSSSSSMDDESLAEDEDSASATASSDSEEESLSWDELERQAIRDDRKRAKTRREDEEVTKRLTKKPRK